MEEIQSWVCVQVVEQMLGDGPTGLKSAICLKVRPAGRTSDEMRSAEMHRRRLAALDAKIQVLCSESPFKMHSFDVTAHTSLSSDNPTSWTTLINFQETVDENNILQVTVKLKEGIVDPEYASHSQYLDDVCARTMPILTSIVDCDIMPCTQLVSPITHCKQPDG